MILGRAYGPMVLSGKCIYRYVYIMITWNQVMFVHLAVHVFVFVARKFSDNNN